MKKSRITRRGALLATALTVTATPAFASLVVQNFMQADLSVADACFVKTAGDDIGTYTAADGDDPNATFNATGDVDSQISIEGANLLEEQISIRGMKGDRVSYTDVVRYENKCNYPLDVTLVATGTAGTGDWADRSARIYLSSTSAALGATTTPAGIPGDATSDWDATPIIVEAGGTIPATNAQTGTVTVPAGEQLYGAISIAAGVNATTTGTGSVNWIAQAVHNN